MASLFLFLHLFLFHFPSFSSSFNFSCHHDESSALLQFKASFTINSESFHSCDESLLKTATWKNETDCCSWHGVTCDTISGHVIGLNLHCEGLQGTLDPNNTIFRLSHLQTLNLSNNDFSGSSFHSKFGRFPSLTHLDLSDSFLYGEIPTQISQLSKLQSLYLSKNNDLVWKETALKRLVQNATNLRELILDETDMSSIRPNSIGLLFNQSFSLVVLNLHSTRLTGKLKRNLCLPSIQMLYMSNNDELQGQLSELSCSASLRILDLSSCSFKGEIPMSLYNLTHLTFLTLSNNHLNGSIPSSILTLPLLTFLYLDHNELSGQIPNAFQISNKFQVLDLSDNNIRGELPTSLSNLQHLIHLDLSFNSFNGQIPDVFGGMTKLEQLSLYSNNLEGQIPSSLFNLTQLVSLLFSSNKLEGPLPNKIPGFQNLINFNLNVNLLNGTIPSSLLSLPSLVSLDLSNNQLSGRISAISSYSLKNLYLTNNKLQGNIPKSIFNLPNLTGLDLSSNNLSGVVNFQLFSKLTNLELLSLSWNSQLSLIFESNVDYSFSNLQELELSNVNLIEFHNLQGEFPALFFLDLSNNKLNGTMPNWLLEKNPLKFLNLSQNLFMSIDQWINVNTSNGYLSGLDLSFNFLDGKIPLTVCNISSLEFLNLGHNNLTGIVPQCLADSPSLQVLDLHMNSFHGTLPRNFSKDSELVTLNLNDNQLEGHFPKSLSRCKKLEFLNLGSNKIEDNFPNWLQTLQYLKVLVLRENKLHGPIENLKIKHLFPSLIIFDISGNNFSGFLPKAYLKNYEAMKKVTQMVGDSSLQYLDESYELFDGQYTDSVTVATKGNKMTLVKIPKIFVIIDLSRNKFEGEIPNAIGELHALKGLNLSHNRLTGHIPKSIGNLSYLESLDLSSNMLTGVIPSELTNLNGLEVLDLSNNHLAGEIPQGKQFNTFLNDSYEGNLELCGFPLSKICGLEHHSPPSSNNSWSEKKFGFGWEPVAIGYGCGFVIGIGIGYCMFLIGKPRWLVMIFGGQPKRRVKRRIRMRRNHGTTMNQNQMVQMS